MSENYELLRTSKSDVEIFRNETAENSRRERVPNYQNGNGHARKEILKLVWRVFLMDGSSVPRVVVFSGVDHTADSSAICARVGESLASQVEGKVCLIDAEPLSPSLCHYFGINFERVPESEAKSAMPERDKLRSVGGSNLWVISVPSKPAADFTAKTPERLKERLSELADQFSYVLLNAPPVNESGDALMLGRMADGIILVLAANSTRRAAALKARQSLDALNVRILGAVLTQRTYPIPEALYQKL